MVKKSMLWLKLLPLEIDSVKDLIYPREAVRQGENIRGKLPEDLKKLYSLWQSIARDKEEVAVQQKYAKTDEEEHELGLKLEELGARARTLAMIFWLSVADELGLWGIEEQGLGLRKDFEVVTFVRPQLPPFLKGIIELGGDQLQ